MNPQAPTSQLQADTLYPLYQMAKYLDAQLTSALHNPATEEEKILRLVDRYAEVLHAMRQEPPSPASPDVHLDPNDAGRQAHDATQAVTSTLDRPEVDLFMIFTLTIAAILSVLYMI